MNELFHPDSPVMEALEKLGKILILNIFWLIGCIPIITIGVSTVSLYRCMMVYRQKKDVEVIKEFWGSYRREFVQSTKLTLILSLVICLLAVDVYIIAFSKLVTFVPLWVLMGILIILVLNAMGYVFPLQAQFDNTTLGVLKNACLMSVTHIWTSIAVTLINSLPLITALLLPSFFYKSALIWTLLAEGTIAYINVGLLQKVFGKFANLNPEHNEAQ